MRADAVVDPEALGGVDDQDFTPRGSLPVAAPAHRLERHLADRSLAHSDTIYLLPPP